jgi:hypothetical protein
MQSNGTQSTALVAPEGQGALDPAEEKGERDRGAQVVSAQPEVGQLTSPPPHGVVDGSDHAEDECAGEGQEQSEH